MIARLGWSLGLFIGSLMVGVALSRGGLLTEVRADRIIRFVVKWISPVTGCLSFWRLAISGSTLITLPLLGCAISVSTLLPAWLYSRMAGFSKPQTGSFLTCAMFSNIGFLGVFVAFALGGEVGYGFATLYMLSFSPCFYLIGFAIAKRCGHQASTAFPDPDESGELRFYPFVGLLIGLGLSLARVPRPGVYEIVNHTLIPLGTACYLVAIGSQLHLEPPGRRLASCLAMGAIKFWYSPLVAWILVSCFQLTGIARVAVLIQASMPVAISPLMLPLLFGLDRKLSSALFLVTTLLAIPWLVIYLPLIR